MHHVGWCWLIAVLRVVRQAWFNGIQQAAASVCKCRYAVRFPCSQQPLPARSWCFLICVTPQQTFPLQTPASFVAPSRLQAASDAALRASKELHTLEVREAQLKERDASLAELKASLAERLVGLEGGERELGERAAALDRAARELEAAQAAVKTGGCGWLLGLCEAGVARGGPQAAGQVFWPSLAVPDALGLSFYHLRHV